MVKPYSDSVRVVTWNIHGAVGADQVHDPQRTARVIRGLDADILALQEVGPRRGGERSQDPFAYFGTALGGHALTAKAVSTVNGDYGQLLLSRWPLRERRVHDISVEGREPRKILEALVEMPAGPLLIIATHLGLSARERRHQFRALAEVARRHPNLPRVLMGDLNEWQRRGAGHRVLAPLFDVCTSHRTFPASMPLWPLDRIYCKPGRLLARSWAENIPCRASDHLPLVAEINLHKGGRRRP